MTLVGVHLQHDVTSTNVHVTVARWQHWGSKWMFEASAMLLRCAHLRAEVDVSLSQCSYELSGVLEVNIVVGGAVHDHVLLAAEILGFVGYVCIL